MTQAAHFHVPHPSARPGDAPDFSYLKLSDAGAVERPAPDARVHDIEHLAYGLVRVLDDKGQAVGPWAPSLDAETLREGLRAMLLTRAFDDRLLRMQRQGKLSFFMQTLGEEAVSVASAFALKPSDMLFPHYRNVGLHLARGLNPVDLMCQCLSNSRDMCKGRQMPIMYHWARGNIFSISGNLATQFPQAVGWAMAAAIKNEAHIAAAWVGEGSTAEADFHHALTFAAVYRPPVVLNVVNNQWAISTFQGFAGGERRPFAARGLGYGIASIRVDGNDFLAVHAVTHWAAERARMGRGPTLVELVTYRRGAHSTSDDPSRYRPRDEWKAWPLGDPIERLHTYLVAGGDWSDADQAALADECKAQVDACWQEALTYGSMTEPPRLDQYELFEDVYRDMPRHLIDQRDALRALNGYQPKAAPRPAEG